VKIPSGLIVLALLAAGAFGLATITPDILDVGAGGPNGLYDPVQAGEQTPEGFTQLLPRDAISPVYEPTFRSVDFTEWPAQTLVIGLESNGESKAYPVSFLNRREMVIDWIGGSPVLVTW